MTSACGTGDDKHITLGPTLECGKAKPRQILHVNSTYDTPAAFGNTVLAPHQPHMRSATWTIRTKSPRALEVMLPHLMHDADMRVRFAQEARIVGDIVSDHLVRVLDAGIDEAAVNGLGQAERAKRAKEAANAVEGRLSRWVIAVPGHTRGLSKLEVRVDGAVWNPDRWDKPIDGTEYTRVSGISRWTKW